MPHSRMPELKQKLADQYRMRTGGAWQPGMFVRDDDTLIGEGASLAHIALATQVHILLIAVSVRVEYDPDWHLHQGK